MRLIVLLKYLVSGMILLSLNVSQLDAQQANFSNATIFSHPGSSELIKKAVQILQEEVAKRSSVVLPVVSKTGLKNEPTIVVGMEQELNLNQKNYQMVLASLSPTDKDGFKVVLLNDNNTVLVAGHDERGVIYGVGYLLRKMELRKGKVMIPERLSISSTPRFAIRGQHISNFFDKDSSEQVKAFFEQYLRELMYFGLNYVSVNSPEQAQLCKEYGLDVSIYMANVGKDFESAEGISVELAKREKIFRSMPKLNEVFVPAGDPGDLDPDVLFKWLEKLAPVLAKYHPYAKIWVSAQNNNKGKATQEWYDGFYNQVNRKYVWLGGVVFGPWVRTPIDEMRKIVRPDIPIRMFPDITHLLGCQYPAPDLDLVFASTLGRMSIQPRPEGFKHIHNLYAHLAVGSRPYSEGNSDDVNKFIWSHQDWNPKIAVAETLRDYARLFIGPDFTDGVTAGLLALERNIKGPLISNDNVERTLWQWQAMEKKADLSVLQNPRFQLGLIRAYYDFYQQQRLIYETFLENCANEILRNALSSGSLRAFEEAENILSNSQKKPVCQEYKNRIITLYDALFRSPAPRWMTEWQKCEFIERIDVPLNNSEWMLEQFDSIKKEESEPVRLMKIQKMLHRTDPGIGGFYDNMGSPESSRRIKSRITAEEDPGSQIYPRRNYIRGTSPIPQSWKIQLATLYEEPLVMAYDHLDPGSGYTIRINYSGGIGRGQSKIRLVADGKYVVHDFINTEKMPIQEFTVPLEALADGRIEFSWTCDKGERGSPVAEVWLIKK